MEPPTQTTSETTTVWEFLFPEVKKETAKASQNVREDLSSFLLTYSKGLDDLYQAIDQNPCKTWGISTAPISLRYPFPTKRTIDEFFDTHDSEVVYPVKCMTSFISYINNAINRAETEFYPKLALFGETIEDIESPSEVLDNECGIPTGDLEILMSEFFPTLQELANFLPEVFSVGQKFLEYILFLYSQENPLFKDFFMGTVLYTAFGALGRLLRLIYTIEQLVAENDSLAEGWEHLRRMTFIIKNEPGNYNAQAQDVASAEQAMAQIHRIVFGGSLVTLFFNSIAHLIVRPSSKQFASMLERYLEEESGSYIRLQNEGKFADKESEICELTLLFHTLTFFLAQPKKKIIQNLWSTHQISPVVKLFHFVTFSAVSYLQENLVNLVTSNVGNDALRNVQVRMSQFLINHDNALGSAVAQSFTKFSSWQANCQKQLQLGLSLAYFIKSSITRTIDLHFAFSKPIDANNLQHLGRLIEILKAIQMTFFLNQAAISHNLPTQVEIIIKKLDEALQKVAATMRKHTYRAVRTRASNLVSLAYHCIRQFSGEYSTTCLQIISDMFASRALNGLGFTRGDIFGTLRSLDLLGHYNDHIDTACDTSFLFDSRELFDKLMEYCQKTPRRILFLALAVNDIGDLFKHSNDLYSKLEEYFTKMLRSEFIQPILSALETELRFHAHQHLAVSERNPLKKPYAQFDKFLQIPPFKMIGRFFDMHYEASYYFTRVFYNETTVAPQVWETYTEMANLLQRLYGVSVLDCHIPGAMMQQEIDVLEIMRNISVFVSCYNYDLNSQVFVQRAEDSHHISIVGIPHIFSSYRCHGIGIMNTTVDFTYRFLKSKFNIFSKFLFDDIVKSRLFNDITWFEQHKEECGGMWPYDRAEKFVTDMKRIAATPNGLSALDHFRILITEIGNALGFVRMVKSGGTRYLNNAIGFVYDDDDDLSFKEFADEVPLPAHTVTATERLDSIVKKLKELFNSGESFFKMLVDVFSGPFRNKKNVHLTTFYAILPALTLSYIEHIMVLKDKAMKQNKNSSFSDDGFPMGIAYILKLLNQDALFDSIHWFDSMKKRAEAERAEVVKTSNGRSTWGFFTGDNKQTVKLAFQMIERRLKEYDLLETTVHSARILFN
jgi:WASH complex subunit 7